MTEVKETMVSRRLQIAGLGEVLWDMFPDGPRFGGATANFACSVAAVGADDVSSLLMSAVGRDALGKQALAELDQRSVDTSCVASTPQPTGQVFVELSPDGQPAYRFLENTAWDNIPCTPRLIERVSALDAVCFGTLGQRSSVSRATIRTCLNSLNAECLRILDINLRPPFWANDVILESLPFADVLKLNSDELPVLQSILGLSNVDHESVRQLMDRYRLKIVALTRGSNGSVLFSQDGEMSALPATQIMVADTVGAGDAFTAAMVVGLLKQRSLSELHRWADQVAAFVCTQRGATPEFPESLRYRKFFESDN